MLLSNTSTIPARLTQGKKGDIPENIVRHLAIRLYFMNLRCHKLPFFRSFARVVMARFKLRPPLFLAIR
jgi:hypothetical protein